MSATTCLRCGNVFCGDIGRCPECDLRIWIECEDSIRCPWCNELINPVYLRTEYIVCHHCGKRIRIEKRVMYDSYPASEAE